jgi:4-hydroxybenzoate polyprenyltransferase
MTRAASTSPGYDDPMFRLLALLQLTRAALAFTAVADAWAVLLLRLPSQDSLSFSQPAFWLMILKMLVVAVVSLGLYGFGTALNDLLDARRDRVLAPRRPIPSGRIKPRGAVIVAVILLMAALLAAALLTLIRVWEVSAAPHAIHLRDIVPYSLFFTIATALLIVFYDATSKYLGGLGIITLGLIRALHCLIGHPQTPLMFLSMILLTHIIIVSAVAYRLENKRPRLNHGDLVTIVLGILIGNGILLWYMVTRRQWSADLLPMLWGPAIALIAYAVWAGGIMLNKRMTPRQKGERLMLMGGFWLFVYDASMLVANGQYLAGVAITLLLLCAVGSFFGIRWLSRGWIFPRVGFRIERVEGEKGGAT